MRALAGIPVSFESQGRLHREGNDLAGALRINKEEMAGYSKQNT